MKKKLIAREKEVSELQRCYESDEAEFVIVCGRHRIGKTYLIDQFFNKNYTFKFVGRHNDDNETQLKHFAKALRKFSGVAQPKFQDWSEAFDALEDYIESIGGNQKKVIFFDEMPWIDRMDDEESDFIHAFEYFWNSWGASRDDILFIATGSSTSWMVDKLIENQGGLHNRITCTLYLSPFTLREVEEYLKNRRINWNRYQILQCYMLTGGVPFYLKLLDPKLSLAQNIDKLCFAPNAPLKMEFDELYPALFSDSKTYINIVHLLAQHKDGLTKDQIFEKIKTDEKIKDDEKKLSDILKNLQRSDFIAKRSQFNSAKKGCIFRLTDFYTLFYFKFIESNNDLNPNWWTHHMMSQKVLGWMGRSFELICLQHHTQIKKALGISGMATSVSNWRKIGNSKEGVKGAQIDLVIERADNMIHLCEIKFSIDKYELKSEYEDFLRTRMSLFKESTGTNKPLLLTFITTYGLSNPNVYSSIHSELTMDDLFI